MRHDPEVIHVYSRSMLAAVKPTGQVRQYVDDAEALRKWYTGQTRDRSWIGRATSPDGVRSLSRPP